MALFYRRVIRDKEEIFVHRDLTELDCTKRVYSTITLADLRSTTVTIQALFTRETWGLWQTTTWNYPHEFYACLLEDAGFQRVRRALLEPASSCKRGISSTSLRGHPYNTIQYNGEFALINWLTNCQFNLAHKLKRTETFKRKMKWEILRIEIVLNVKMTKFEKWLK